MKDKMEKYYDSFFMDEYDRDIFRERIAICIFEGGLDELSAANEALRAINVFNSKRIWEKLNEMKNIFLKGKTEFEVLNENFNKNYKKL